MPTFAHAHLKSFAESTPAEFNQAFTVQSGPYDGREVANPKLLAYLTRPSLAVSAKWVLLGGGIDRTSILLALPEFLLAGQNEPLDVVKALYTCAYAFNLPKKVAEECVAQLEAITGISDNRLYQWFVDNEEYRK